MWRNNNNGDDDDDRGDGGDDLLRRTTTTTGRITIGRRGGPRPAPVRRTRSFPPPPRPVAVAREVLADSSWTPWLVYEVGHPADPFDNNNNNDDDDDVRAGAGGQEHEGEGEEGAAIGYDSENEDDITNVVDHRARHQFLTVGRAGRLLSVLGAPHPRYPRYRLRDLLVTFDPRSDGVSRRARPNNNNDNGRPLLDPRNEFNAFVNALQSYRRIKRLTLVHGNFLDEGDIGVGSDGGRIEGARRGGGGVGDDVDKMFGSVLSRHPSLKELTIRSSHIGTRTWRLFTDNWFVENPTVSSFDRLVLHETPMNAGHCQLLKQLLCRRNVPLTQLEIVECGLRSEQWHVVAMGVQGNTHLRSLTLAETRVVTIVGPTTLVPLVNKPSALNRLDVRAAFWADGAFERFVDALKTNDTLQHLTLHRDDEHWSPFRTHVEELLTTYNFTLETLTMVPWTISDGDGAATAVVQAPIQQLLERNRHVRNLAQPNPGRSFERYRVSVPAVWPTVLRDYSRFPTLLHRFLRHANLDALVRSVTPLAVASEGLGDDGPADDDDDDDELGGLGSINHKKRGRPELTSE